MVTQAEKYNLSLAGEFFVAAQLQRLGIAASVTYGNAKRADVIALGRTKDKAVVIEVKSSGKSRWPVGNRTPAPSTQPWVFVHIPADSSQPVEYYVLTQRELHTLLSPGQAQYFAAYEAKHGVPYGDRPGVIAFTREMAKPYRDNWDVILSQL